MRGVHSDYPQAQHPGLRASRVCSGHAMSSHRTTVILTEPKNPPRFGPPSARYETGRGNYVAEALLGRGHEVIMWWDHPPGELIECEPTAALIRSSRPPQLERAATLASQGVVVVNDPVAHGRSGDKRFQAAMFARCGIPHPETIDPEVSPYPRDEMVVIKPAIGSSGFGVRSGIWSELSASVEPGDIVQPMLRRIKEVRVTVVGGRALGWAERTPALGDFRANLALGATMRPIGRPSAEIEDLARRAVDALDLAIGGVDIVITSEGPVVLEVNAATTLHGPTLEETNVILNEVIDLIETKFA